MSRYISLLLLSITTVTASAQEPKSIKTVKVTQSLNATALYEVKEDGTVLIDWDEVEAFAASKQNPLLTPQAQVMLAIRDSKWKAMGRAK
jgi:hypothetical protein